MFLRYYDVLELPVESVEERLLEGPGAWVPGLAEDCIAEGDRLLVQVGLGDGFAVRKTVEITVGDPVRRAATIALPIRWQAVAASALFPILEGEMEIVPLGTDRTQIAVSATYTPPLDGFGRIADRALLHRVAEATVKNFVDRVVDRILASQEESRAGHVRG